MDSPGAPFYPKSHSIETRGNWFLTTNGGPFRRRPCRPAEFVATGPTQNSTALREFLRAHTRLGSPIRSAQQKYPVPKVPGMGDDHWISGDDRFPVFHEEFRRVKGSDFEVVTPPQGYVAPLPIENRKKKPACLSQARGLKQTCRFHSSLPHFAVFCWISEACQGPGRSTICPMRFSPHRYRIG